MHQMEQKIVLFNVYDCIYWYTYEDLGKWFVSAPGKILHVNFLEYEHWFMSIRIYHMKDHYISVDQARYTTSIVEKYLYSAIFKTSTKIYRTTLPFDMIFTKANTYNSAEKF